MTVSGSPEHDGTLHHFGTTDPQTRPPSKKKKRGTSKNKITLTITANH